MPASVTRYGLRCQAVFFRLCGKVNYSGTAKGENSRRAIPLQKRKHYNHNNHNKNNNKINVVVL